MQTTLVAGPRYQLYRQSVHRPLLLFRRIGEDARQQAVGDHRGRPARSAAGTDLDTVDALSGAAAERRTEPAVPEAEGRPSPAALISYYILG
jgi:hypothetical protein